MKLNLSGMNFAEEMAVKSTDAPRTVFYIYEHENRNNGYFLTKIMWRFSDSTS